MTEVQRSFAPSILERQVTAAADIQAFQVTGSNQPQAVVSSRYTDDRSWPGVSFRAFAVKQPLKSCCLVHDKGSTTVSLLQISVCSEISSASSTSMPRYRTVDSSLACPSSN